MGFQQNKTKDQSQSIDCLVLFSQSVNAQAKAKPWPVPDKDKALKSTEKLTDAAVIANGKDLWAKHCKSCHGAKGKGDGSKAEKIDISCGDFSSPESAKISDGELYWKTTQGRKPMPSYKEKLSDNERWAVVNYLRTLEVK